MSVVTFSGGAGDCRGCTKENPPTCMLQETCFSYLLSATEYRNWLFYYSLPCMKDVLDDELHQHYSLLVGGIYLLSGTSISPEQLEKAGELLIHFVEMFDVYYGESLNIRVGKGNSTYCFVIFIWLMPGTFIQQSREP